MKSRKGIKEFRNGGYSKLMKQGLDLRKEFNPIFSPFPQAKPGKLENQILMFKSHFLL